MDESTKYLLGLTHFNEMLGFEIASLRRNDSIWNRFCVSPVYIVLAYYETADKSNKKGQEAKNKLTNQHFNNEFVKYQIDQILAYRQSALHWNQHLFEQRFVEIFETALDAYDSISDQTGVLIHSRSLMDKYLLKITNEFEQFKNISLKNSYQASKREAMTFHKQEYLADGVKATLSIENYLGGLYYLTTDEIQHISLL